MLGLTDSPVDTGRAKKRLLRWRGPSDAEEKGDFSQCGSLGPIIPASFDLCTKYLYTTPPVDLAVHVSDKTEPCARLQMVSRVVVALKREQKSWATCSPIQGSHPQFGVLPWWLGLDGFVSLHSLQGRKERPWCRMTKPSKRMGIHKKSFNPGTFRVLVSIILRYLFPRYRRRPHHPESSSFPRANAPWCSSLLFMNGADAAPFFRYDLNRKVVTTGEGDAAHRAGMQTTACITPLSQLRLEIKTRHRTELRELASPARRQDQRRDIEPGPFCRWPATDSFGNQDDGSIY